MRKRLKRESSRNRRWRKREATRKKTVPKGTVEAPKPIGPVHTHDDTATLENAKAVMEAIAARDEQEAQTVHEHLGDVEADQAAAEEEQHKLEDEQTKAEEHRADFVDNVRNAGLGHMLVHRRVVNVIVVIAMLAAILFETISMSSPMALVSAIDFGGNAHTEERIGAVLALLLALGYATLLAILSKRAGAEAKARHYRPILEAENADDDAAEDRPPTKHAVFADRMVWLAVAAGLAALFGASLVREQAVAILASASSNAVPVSWWVFAALTMGIFVGLFTLGYWSANPIAKAYAEINHGIGKRGKQIDAKRRECYRAAGRVESLKTKLQMIAVRSLHEQLAQLHLAFEEIAWRASGNSHIYGVTTDPKPIQEVIANPQEHVRPLTLPSVERTLRNRIEKIRSRSKKAAEETPQETQAPVLPGTGAYEIDPSDVSNNRDRVAA